MIIYYTDKFTGGREESHRLLKDALEVYTGDEERAKTLIRSLKKGEHGKPYIEGFSCFSISHTGSVWAVLFADRECGLDIQFGRDCDIKAISSRFFAPGDAAVIKELCIEGKNDESAEAFFRAWTRREALTKAVGGTVYDPDIPEVLTGEADIGGRHYKLTEAIFPDMDIDSRRKLYTAVCIEGRSACPDISFHLL